MGWAEKRLTSRKSWGIIPHTNTNNGQVTARSAHAFAYTANRYRILSHGASMGENYGPIVVTRRPCTLDELRQMSFAIPGTLTSGFLMLRLLLGDITYRQTRFDTILEEVASGRADAGLIIYE